MKIFEQIPLSLILSWTFLFGFENIHQMLVISYKDSRETYPLYNAVEKSSQISGIISLALFGYYFALVDWWFYPFLLFSAGTIISLQIIKIASVFVGEKWLIRASFLGWPLSAIWMALTLVNLNHSLRGG